MRFDGVVPFAVKFVRMEVNLSQFLITDLNTRWIRSCIKTGFYLETSFRPGGTDEIDNNLMTDQRPPAPVHGDIRKQAMLNLVPFAGAGREMANRDLQAAFISQVLDFNL